MGSVEADVRAFHADDWDLALTGREREIAITEAEDWLRDNPSVLAERIQAEPDSEFVFDICRIFTDTKLERDERSAQARAVVEKKIEKFAEIEARKDFA